MPISCHFRDYKALLFESRKQPYNKYTDLYLSAFVCLPISDIQCGLLHCDISAVTSLQKVNFRAPWSRAANWSYPNGRVCRIAEYLTFYNGPDRPDPGLVPNGASCGVEKVTRI